MFKNTIVAFCFAAFLINLSGCFEISRQHNFRTQDYHIQPGDVIHIRFANHPDLERNLTVDANGRVVFTALGAIKVAGKTAEQLKVKLDSAYRAIIAAPDIEVIIRESQNFTVYFGGEVKQPGIFSFQQNMSVAQGLLMAGGFVGEPKAFQIFVFRENAINKSRVYRIDLGKGKIAKKIISGFKLKPDDVVLVLKNEENIAKLGFEI